MQNGAAPTFVQISDAMAKINDQINATPPPSAALKQSLTETYQKLQDAQGDMALDDYGSAADSVSDAAKQLQDVIDSGAANGDALQQILASLGALTMPG